MAIDTTDNQSPVGWLFEATYSSGSYSPPFKEWRITLNKPDPAVYNKIVPLVAMKQAQPLPPMTPSPDQIRTTRRLAHLTQAQAAALVHSNGNRWSEWERGIYAMHPGLWELFTLKLRK